LLVVGDDDQNIYAFGGANVRFIRQFETDYQAKRYHLIENYRSTTHIIDCSNRVIARARERMKGDQAIRINHARRGISAGGDFAKLDPITEGRVHVLDVPPQYFGEVESALAELLRLNGLEGNGENRHWGRFAVIARQWEHLEPMAAACRLKGVPVRLMRDDHLPDLHSTREGHHLLALLKGNLRHAGRHRVLLRSGTLTRWFHRRFAHRVDDLIEHPQRAALAQFILECESAAPGAERVVFDLIELLYEFGAGGKSASGEAANGPLLLLTAHRAKGLEFDHVLILDGGGWPSADDEERRLFYVAMTRARKTLTLCERQKQRHAFIPEFADLCLKSTPADVTSDPRLAHRIWVADPEQVVLSWPGYFSQKSPIHQAMSKLNYGDDLTLRLRGDGKAGWEIADGNGVAVTRMAQKFKPPAGEILAVRVSTVLVRRAKEGESVRCPEWELVLPEIEHLPTTESKVGAQQSFGAKEVE
jgi:ATP-dependent DNA helicase RecQ